MDASCSQLLPVICVASDRHDTAAGRIKKNKKTQAHVSPLVGSSDEATAPDRGQCVRTYSVVGHSLDAVPRWQHVLLHEKFGVAIVYSGTR